VPVTVQQTVSVETADAPVVNSIQYVDTGVILRVRMSVIHEKLAKSVTVE
jgi:type II secretory pathway component GspD/PulD (secretin)